MTDRADRAAGADAGADADADADASGRRGPRDGPQDGAARTGAARTGAAAWAAAHGTGRAARLTARATGRGTARAARVTARGARGGARAVRRATHAQGAGETGLGRLVELHGLSMAGDALLAVALAGTLFFSVPVGEARGRVALWLLATMAPYAVLAPVVGPLLDRLRSGRRLALAGTFALRGALVLVMAGALDDGLRLYPAAFGCLVLSRAYGVLRATAVPRVLPAAISLVSANGRAQLAGTLAAVAAGLLGAGAAALVGPAWALVAAAAVLGLGAGQSLRLPRRVDSAAGEVPARLRAAPAAGPAAAPDAPPDARPDPAAGAGRRRRWDVGPPVVRALRANAALRAYSGFLTLFLAFLLREDPVGSLPTAVTVGLVVGGAAAGSALGTAAGTLLGGRRPDTTVVTVLGTATVTAGVGGWLYGGALVLALVALAAGACQSLGKLALDAIVQQEVPEPVRASAFARAETLLQLAWVVGGGLGLLLPVPGAAGLPLPVPGAAGLLLAAAGLAAATLLTLRRGGRE